VIKASISNNWISEDRQHKGWNGLLMHVIDSTGKFVQAGSWSANPYIPGILPKNLVYMSALTSAQECGQANQEVIGHNQCLGQHIEDNFNIYFHFNPNLLGVHLLYGMTLGGDIPASGCQLQDNPGQYSSWNYAERLFNTTNNYAAAVAPNITMIDTSFTQINITWIYTPAAGSTYTIVFFPADNKYFVQAIKQALVVNMGNHIYTASVSLQA
jgi:hypothetical protein